MRINRRNGWAHTLSHTQWVGTHSLTHTFTPALIDIWGGYGHVSLLLLMCLWGVGWKRGEGCKKVSGGGNTSIRGEKRLFCASALERGATSPLSSASNAEGTSPLSSASNAEAQKAKFASFKCLGIRGTWKRRSALGIRGTWKRRKETRLFQVPRHKRDVSLFHLKEAQRVSALTWPFQRGATRMEVTRRFEALERGATRECCASLKRLFQVPRHKRDASLLRR